MLSTTLKNLNSPYLTACWQSFCFKLCTSQQRAFRVQQSPFVCVFPHQKYYDHDACGERVSRLIDHRFILTGYNSISLSATKFSLSLSLVSHQGAYQLHNSLASDCSPRRNPISKQFILLIGGPTTSSRTVSHSKDKSLPILPFDVLLVFFQLQ